MSTTLAPLEPTPTEYRLAMNESRLLREFPNFFQSFSDALTELTQNAYRAGAQNIWVTLDRACRTLEFRDDGRGAIDPTPLLTAGTTGWDENQVVDPAGLGLFALLGTSERLEIMSVTNENAWVIELTEDAFLGEPVTRRELNREESKYAEAHGTGLTIRAELKQSTDLDLRLNTDRLFTFASFFPVTVHVVQDASATTEPVVYAPPVLSDIKLVTPVGTLYRDAPTPWSPYRSAPSITIVWEHRRLNQNLGDALLQTLRNRYGMVGDWAGRLIQGGTYYWHVDESAAVRPKLPDRKELILDEHFNAAVNTLADAIVVEFNAPQRIQQVDRETLPRVACYRYRDQYSDKHVGLEIESILDRIELPALFFRRQPVLLEMLGYQRVVWQDYNVWEFSGSKDDPEVRFENHVRYVQEPLEVGSVELAEALCRADVYAVGDSTPSEYTIEIENERDVPFFEIPLRLSCCSGLWLCRDCERVLELPWFTGDTYLIDPDNDYEEEYSLVYHGTAEEFRKAARDGQFMGATLKALFSDTGNVDDYENGTDGYVDIDEKTIMRDLLRAITRKLFPQNYQDYALWDQLARIQQAYYSLGIQVNEMLDRFSSLQREHPQMAGVLAEPIRHLLALQHCPVNADEYKVDHDGNE